MLVIILFSCFAASLELYGLHAQRGSISEEITDREIAFLYLSKSEGKDYQHLSEELKKDKEIVLYTLRNGLDDIPEDMGDELLQDKDVILAYFKSSVYSGANRWKKIRSNERIPLEEMLKGRKFFLEVLSTSFGSNLILDSKLEAFDYFTDDKEIVMKVINVIKNPKFVLLKISDELQRDEDVIIEAMRRSKSDVYTDILFEIYSTFLMIEGRDNRSFEWKKEFTLFALSLGLESWKISDTDLFSDFDFVLRSLQVVHTHQRTWILSFMEESMRCDWDFNLELSTINMNLVCDEHKRNEEFVLDALSKNHEAVDKAWVKEYYISGYNREFFKKLFSRNGMALKMFADMYRVGSDKLLSFNIEHDKELVLIAVRQNGRAIEYASEELKNDPEVVQASTSQIEGLEGIRDSCSTQVFVWMLLFICVSESIFIIFLLHRVKKSTRKNEQKNK